MKRPLTYCNTQKTAESFAKNAISLKASFWGLWVIVDKIGCEIFFANRDFDQNACVICEKWVSLRPMKSGEIERDFRKSLFSVACH